MADIVRPVSILLYFTSKGKPDVKTARYPAEKSHHPGPSAGVGGCLQRDMAQGCAVSGCCFQESL